MNTKDKEKQLCKCKSREEYWNARGNKRKGYFTRRDLFMIFTIGAIPLIGQVLWVMALIGVLIKQDENDRVLKKYRGSPKSQEAKGQ